MFDLLNIPQNQLQIDKQTLHGVDILTSIGFKMASHGEMAWFLYAGPTGDV